MASALSTPDVSEFEVRLPFPSRFADLDAWGHLNNVAAAALHQEALQAWLRQRLPPDLLPSDDWVIRPRSTHIQFSGEGQYPAPFELAAHATGYDRHSWAIQTAIFQNDQCIGTQLTRLGTWQLCSGEPVPLPDALSQRLQRFGLKCAEPADWQPNAPQEPASYPFLMTLPSRYVDQDPLPRTSELAIMRYCEEGRVRCLRQAIPETRDILDAHGLGIVVVSILVHYRKLNPLPPDWQLGIGALRSGRTSFAFRTGIFDPHSVTRSDDCVAISDGVQVLIDRATRRAAPMPEAFRHALEQHFSFKP